VRRGSRIGGLFIVFFPEGRAAGLAPLRPTALEDRAGRPHWKTAMPSTPTGARSRPTIRSSPGSRPAHNFRRLRPRHPPVGPRPARYACDGAFLLGDAIHPVSPAGGQGADMSVADANAVLRIATPLLPRALARSPQLLPRTFSARHRRRSSNHRRPGKRSRGGRYIRPPRAPTSTAPDAIRPWSPPRPDRLIAFTAITPLPPAAPGSHGTFIRQTPLPRHWPERGSMRRGTSGPATGDKSQPAHLTGVASSSFQRKRARVHATAPLWAVAGNPPASEVG
jgi:hypothetical protein